MPEQRETDPYPGPRPFEEDEQDVFFGRDAETRELVSLVVAHPAVLLYAASGAGKTSLLNAGVIPMLQAHGFEVLPLLRIGTSVQNAPVSGEQNVYTAAILSNLEEALEQDLPSRTSLADALVPPENKQSSLVRVLILDQFEELFTTYPESWQQREDVFREIAKMLRPDECRPRRDKRQLRPDERQRLRIIVAIREDYLADVDSYAELVPGALRVRVRLEPLEKDAALHAVEDPLRRTRRSFAPGVAEELVDNLLQQRIGQRATVSASGGGFLQRFSARLQRVRPEPREIRGKYVEPVQLQVVCRSLWDALPQDVTTITPEDLKSYGDVDQALGRFYEEALRAARKAARIREGKLRSRVEEAFITPGGTRALVFCGERSVDGIPSPAIDVLKRKRLIRSVTYAGAPHCELTHDRLIDPIRASNERYTSAKNSRVAIGTVSVSLAVALAAVVALLVVPQDSEPSAAINPSVKFFGAVQAGQSRESVVVFQNGPTPTSNIDVHVTPDKSDFRALTPQASDCGHAVPLERGKTCFIRLTFKPSSLGSKTAVLRVTYGSGAILQAPLKGTGIGRVALRLSPTKIDFGRIPRDRVGIKDVVLRNGTTPVRIIGYETTSAEFQVSSSCTIPATLGAQASCTFPVTFVPGPTSGRRAEALRIVLRDRKLSIPLTGFSP